MTRSRSRRALRSVGALEVTSFTQALGAEVLVNGDFSAWADGIPTGWTVFQTPPNKVITETAANGGAGTGAVRFVSDGSQDPTMIQAALIPNAWHELILTVSAFTSGALLVRDSLIYFPTITQAGETHLLIRPVDSSLILRAGFTAPHDYVVDRASLRAVTLNPVWRMPDANGTHTLMFTLPGSPKAGQRIEMRYRQQDDLNYWAAVIVRNDANSAWEFQLNSVNGGTATNRIRVTDAGAVDAVRVVTSGSTHTAYTGAGGTFTQRGSPITVSHLDTQTGITAAYASAITPLRLSSD